MAYAKIYSRINWENLKSTSLGATNLNKLDYAVDELDNRVVSLETAKAEQATVLNMVSDFSMDETTGIITITKLNGEQILFDLNIEKIPVSFSLSEEGILSMSTEDGTEFTADIGSMIPVITFENSDTVGVTVIKGVELASDFAEYTHTFDEPYTGNLLIGLVKSGYGALNNRYKYKLYKTYDFDTEVAFYLPYSDIGNVEESTLPVDGITRIVIETSDDYNIRYLKTYDGKSKTYKFDVKKGSISDEYIQPNYLADITVQAQVATNKASEAEGSATRAEASAVRAEKAAATADVQIATENTVGIVKPDNATIGIDADGIIKVVGEYLTEEDAKGYALKTDLDNYLTKIPDEYVTETDLSNKGYALQSDLDDLSLIVGQANTVLESV